MKTVLITGGSRGIGFAAAKCFDENSYNVILTGRDEGRLKAASAQLRNSAYLVWDISEVSSDDAKIAEAEAFFGEIDTFVNNAGIVYGEQLDGIGFPDVSEKAWDTTMDINMKGTFFACQAEAKYMLKRGIKGHIVNVVSEMAYHDSRDPYGISKWGIRAFTPAIAQKLATFGITVNGIAPGETATEIIRKPEGEVYPLACPRGSCAAPNEIGEEIYFLATRANIVGSILLSDGGRSIH